MNKKGSVLMIGLWITSILTVFAVGLGHRSSINLRLARFQRDRLKASLLTMAGLQKAILVLKNDTNAYDSLAETWSTGIDPETQESLLENVELKKGSQEAFTLYIADEERKININRVNTDFQRRILVTLFESLGIERPQELNNLLLNWIDADPDPDDAEKFFKNSNLKSMQEFLLILEYFYKGQEDAGALKKAQEAYETIKDFITVSTEGKININTASAYVLQTIMEAVVKQKQAQGLTDLPTQAQIQELVGTIIAFRQEGKSFETMNDILNNLGIEPTGKKGEIINFLISEDTISVSSQCFSIESVGLIGNKVIKKVFAIVKRSNPPEILSWREN